MRKLLHFFGVLILLLASFNAHAQSNMVTGIIVDNEGIPLPGVAIVVAGTTKGAVSSIDGKYAISGLNKSDSLMYSYVGYETQYRVVDDNEVINIVMQPGDEWLEEVQVVAFQKQKKESVIGSINTIKPSELKLAPTNLTSALAGRVAGMISYQRSGEPGQDNAEFFVRGVTSFGYKNDPLILIDGLEVTSNDLARIEPDNIASFSIMKDATATALYGAKGANGVILVTTKEGKKGKAKVSVRVESSLSSPTMTNKFLGGVEYMELYNQAVTTRNEDARPFYTKDKIEGTRGQLDPMIYPDVQWYDEMFKDYVVNKKANMNVSGGGEVAQYYLAMSYNNEKGLLNVDDVNNFNNNIDINRYNLRANINMNLTKSTKVAVKFYSLFDKYNGPAVSANDLFKYTMEANPVDFPMYHEKDASTQYYNHTLFGNVGAGTAINPYAEMVKGYTDRFSSTILSQVQLEQDLSFITEGLKLRGMASVKSYSLNENARTFDPFYYGIDQVENPDGGIEHQLYQVAEGTEYLSSAGSFSDANSSFYFELIGQYDRTFNSRHSLGALIVTMRRESLNTIEGSNLFSTLPSRNLGISGRLTYGFDSRYFTEFNFGYNGSEKFAENHRYGFFPSAGIAWAVMNEPFFKNLKNTITLLKLKATYGLVGNDAISDPNDRFFYLSNADLNYANSSYSFGSEYSNTYNGYFVDRYANPNVTWEVAEKSNYGIELGLFNKINLIAEYFTEYRSNIYMQNQYTPESMGLTAEVWSNIGEAKSKGFDASLDYQHVIKSSLWVTSRINFTYSTNEFVKNGEPEYEYDYLSSIGNPIDQAYGYVAERLFVDEAEVINSPYQSFEDQPMAGDIKYVDINNDGVINSFDYVPIGYPKVPEIVYGFGASMGYRSIDFSFFFQGLARESFFIDPNAIAPFVNKRNSLEIIADDHWSDENPDPFAFWPRLSTTENDNNTQPSTWWLRDGSFLRLKSLELGYSLPSKITNKINVEKFRIYISGINLLTFSEFKLWDPEMAGNGLGYPPQKVTNIGIHVSF